METTHYYKTNVTWKEGRLGVLSADGFPSINVATPPEFEKGIPNTWSPEHLFVSSTVICLMTTFLAIAEKSKLEFISFDCTGTGKLEKIDGMFMISEIELEPVVKISDKSKEERTLRIIEKSEHHCLISNSIKTKILLKPEIVIV
ncbi:MAG: osmotically inducible protein OsmC [Ignavibacteriales bacterium CG_4_9_14_3_um_filter_30_11]|nr:MAG: osmotically inducible protein OsmC [Ignavibacteriales bacterium CG_4_9_14_3_um_filter_30_11]